MADSFWPLSCDDHVLEKVSGWLEAVVRYTISSTSDVEHKKGLTEEKIARQENEPSGSLPLFVCFYGTERHVPFHPHPLHLNLTASACLSFFSLAKWRSEWDKSQMESYRRKVREERETERNRKRREKRREEKIH